jgi:hypothetical protein
MRGFLFPASAALNAGKIGHFRPFRRPRASCEGQAGRRTPLVL